ncbi:hypothetical protein ACFXG4_48990 [Nocardia sp. NPDC059246]|uniref:hypothetical protein n=1 Tax=unclassified Nocardia TaxID=2637762 RepID=UPI0036BA2797
MTLAEKPDSETGFSRVLFMASDHPSAVEVVAHLWASAGFTAVDLGPLEIGGRMMQFPDGPLAGLNVSWSTSVEHRLNPSRAVHTPEQSWQLTR